MTCSVSYSCVQDGWPGEGNMDADPLLVDPGHWDDNGTPADPSDDFWVDPPGGGDYRLSASSPCIDAGDPGSTLDDDIERYPRPSGVGYDMGAHELQVVGGPSSGGSDAGCAPTSENASVPLLLWLVACVAARVLAKRRPSRVQASVRLS